MHEGRVLEQGTADQVADEYLKRAHARGNERLSAINRTTAPSPRSASPGTASGPASPTAASQACHNSSWRAMT